MKTNCSTPRTTMYGLDFNVFQRPLPCGACHRKTKLVKRRARFSQLHTGDSSDPSGPGGLSTQLPPRTVIHLPCHLRSPGPSLRGLVQRKRLFSHWPFVGWPYVHCDTHTTCMEPSVCLRVSKRGSVTWWEPVGWESRWSSCGCCWMMSCHCVK